MANSHAATLAEALVAHCKQELTCFTDTLTLGYSGGLDSTVLLHALIKAGAHQQLKAVHVHHGLQPLADTWRQYCQQECQALKIPFLAVNVVLQGGHNLEGRARRERRSALLAQTNINGRLVLAQHQNDQAETLLLQLFRGAGPQGLSAMRPLSQYQGYSIWRPLLGFKRTELAKIAKYWQLHWVEDPTNQDLEPDRNYLRQQLIPQLETRWPKIIQTLVRNADLQHEAALLQQEIAQQDWRQWLTPFGGIDIQGFLTLSPERQRNLLYRWLLARGMQPPSQKILARVWQEVLLARPDAMPTVSWTSGVFCRHGNVLYLLTHEEFAPTVHTMTVSLRQSGRYRWGQGELLVGSPQEDSIYLPAHVKHIELGPVPKGAKLKVRGHHRQVRELWREQGLPTWQRLQTPGIYHQQELVAVIGVGVSDKVKVAPNAQSWVLHWRRFLPKCEW